MRVQFDLDVPEGTIDAAFEQGLREEAVLRLFTAGKIPSAVACRLLGVERVAFMQLLTSRGIPHTTYTATDLAEDLAVLEKLRPEIERNVEDWRGSRSG